MKVCIYLLKNLEAIIARPDPADEAAKFEANQRRAEAKRALKLIAP
jgi:hypothetical protein